jgi:peptidoglycan glycosyltransferase
MRAMSEPKGRERRGRRARTALIGLAAAAAIAGAVVGAEHRGASPAGELAARFAKQWEKGEYGAMYQETTAEAQRIVGESEFEADYREALKTATATELRVEGPPRAERGGEETVKVRVKTRLFGTLKESAELPVRSEPEGGPRVEWTRALTFPGLRKGERTGRRTTMPQRAAIEARDGEVLAEGPAEAAGSRASTLGAAASAVVGEVGPVPAERAKALEAEGVPANAIVGVSGLELAEDARLRGTPGGELVAEGTGGGERALASVRPRPAEAVKTTIDPEVQRAAEEALGSQYGGIVAIEPQSGRIEAVAGIGIDALQPPGSTFKMITTSGALEARIATPKSTYGYATSTTLDGVKLENAHGEECGGSLTEAFAVSCNSVFAPLGVKLGAERLVRTAERFGFNRSTGIEGAAESTLPQASGIEGELALGSTAIGQGQVQASALEMAAVAATIADGGRRPAPTFLFGPERSVRAIDAATARDLRAMMEDVVRFGTGTAAAIPGVTVAGKTGTAEVGPPPGGAKACAATGGGEKKEGQGEAGTEAKEGGAAAKSATAKSAEAERCAAAEKESPKNTDAWFAAFAPAQRPRVAVAVLLVRDGAGGTTAAPVARAVLEAGLKATARG